MRESIGDLLHDTVFDSIADMNERVNYACQEAVKHCRLLLFVAEVGVGVVRGREDVLAQGIGGRRSLENLAKVDCVSVEEADRAHQ